MGKTTLPSRIARNDTDVATAERVKIRAHMPRALDRLVELMESENEQVAIAAIKMIFDHSIGRAPQSIELTGDAGAAEGYLSAYRELVASGQLKIEPRKVYEIVQVPGEAVTLVSDPDQDEDIADELEDDLDDDLP